MTYLNEETLAMIGLEGVVETACDPVEQGAVRRYAQAVMDLDPAYADADANPRYGGAIAPPLYPMTMFRRPFGSEDPLSTASTDPDFDGLAGKVAQGLPDLPLPPMVMLNGGTEFEFYRYARHGEYVTAQSKYFDIYEKSGRSGPMIFVKIQTTYRGDDGQKLLSLVKTLIRRPHSNDTTPV